MSAAVDFTRTIRATTATTASQAVRLLAKGAGYRVRTTRRIECVEAGTDEFMALWRVTLAVVAGPVGDCE